MKHLYKFILLPIMFVHICANSKKELAPQVNKQGVVYAVQADVLRLSCERGLLELKAQHPAQAARQQPAQRISPVRASDPVNQ